MSPLQDFSFDDNTSPIPRVYPDSQVFTIMICRQQDLLSKRVNYTTKNHNIYKSLNST
jgi:hypothetical protein